MDIKIIGDGREISLPTKTLEVIRGVIEVSAEIERIVVDKTIFHFKGRSVVPEVSRHFRPLKSEEPADKV